jgi:hypothetical protein
MTRPDFLVKTIILQVWFRHYCVVIPLVTMCSADKKNKFIFSILFYHYHVLFPVDAKILLKIWFTYLGRRLLVQQPGRCSSKCWTHHRMHRRRSHSKKQSLRKLEIFTTHCQNWTLLLNVKRLCAMVGTGNLKLHFLEKNVL